MDAQHRIDKLLSQHQTLRDLIAQFRGIAASGTIPPLSALIEWRWNLARNIMMHLGEEDRLLYLPLEQDLRPHARDMAKKYKASLMTQFTGFQKHIDNWTGESAVEDWPAYSAMVLQLLQGLEDRINGEESDIYPFLRSSSTQDKAGIAPANHNWARDGFHIKDKIQGRI